MAKGSWPVALQRFGVYCYRQGSENDCDDIEPHFGRHQARRRPEEGSQAAMTGAGGILFIRLWDFSSQLGTSSPGFVYSPTGATQDKTETAPKAADTFLGISSSALVGRDRHAPPPSYLQETSPEPSSFRVQEMKFGRSDCELHSGALTGLGLTKSGKHRLPCGIQGSVGALLGSSNADASAFCCSGSDLACRIGFWRPGWPHPVSCRMGYYASHLSRMVGIRTGHRSIGGSLKRTDHGKVRSLLWLAP